jgi:histidine decarboxylase
MMIKARILLVQALIFVGLSVFAQTSGIKELDEWTEKWKTGQQTYFGYPANKRSEMSGFYEWYLSTGMEVVNLNNAGDPMTNEPWSMS